MFDIGAMELFIIAIVALIVVGPKDLPRLLKTVGGFVRKARDMAAEFRAGVETLADEVEREVDPFHDLKKQEGITPEMTAEDITNHIMGNRASEMAEQQKSDTAKPDAVPPKESDKTSSNGGNDASN
ncbi:Sec-independent protein translocase protein TatB [Kordiimonas sp. SCSIO 12610]|uniref:Sec-independent protein translocase protein TatB n=1 Tax=Kordiimonas sp. SCSIO 12610 TaxID=2829597 RepID=UPI00210D7A0B|nr:Sec-independent protein translocase protein TatB [Kordiimonas sp. SCSIO 12610]UTW54229.1 twin-arginine translocase subunit TatB [Kordiimonas sp. SCSIO 12610]